MPRFRNGNRLVDAFQEASGDWLVIDLKVRSAWPEADRVFRGKWEPADQEATELWEKKGKAAWN